MTIIWFGHAAFLVESAGVRILLDPYRSPDAGGYAPIDKAADVVFHSSPTLEISRDTVPSQTTYYVLPSAR